MTYTINTTFTCTFTCKSSADATDSKEYTIPVDISDLSSEDIVEWMCNNGIIVYLQGRIRAGKLVDGQPVKLHKPGTRSAGVPVDPEEIAQWKPLLLQMGQITVDTSDKDIAAIIKAVKKLQAKKSEN